MARVSKPLDEDYAFVESIGRGSFGETSKYLCRSDQKHYVVKKIGITRRDTMKSAYTELKHLSTLRNRCIVSYKDAYIQDGFMYIIMEFCAGGDVSGVIADHGGRKCRISEEQILDWTLQLCLGLQYIHEQRVIHRDLKPANIFLTASKAIKIGDFGISRDYDPNENLLLTAGVGTPVYMSPEVISGKKYDGRADVWSLGCCLFEMLTLHPAIDSMTAWQSMKRGSFNMPSIPKEVRDYYSNGLVELAETMLTHDQSRRPTVQQLLQTSVVSATKERFDRSNRVFVSLQVTGKQSKDFVVNLNWTIDEMYKKVADVIGMNVDDFALYVGSRPLKNHDDSDAATDPELTYVGDLALVHHCTVNVVLRVQGGFVLLYGCMTVRFDLTMYSCVMRPCG